MPHLTTGESLPATGLQCLAMVLRLHQQPSNLSQLNHQFGYQQELDESVTILRAAKAIGFKGKLVKANITRLRSCPLPAIARCSDGHFVVIAKTIGDDKILIQDPLETRPLVLPTNVFCSSWSGDLIVLKQKIFAPGEKAFGLRWFVPSLIKYRKLFAEVLVASFFVQVLALITPLFFQVVIDKVLVHRGMATLDILMIGLFGVVLFEVMLAGLRTYIFSHTTNRVDVELGGKVFDHLLALPLSYFRSRRIGDSVARVRELETIRSFITGTSLTLVIDFLFTIVFIVVLYCYSPVLTSIVVAATPCYLILSALITPILRRRLNEKFARGAENQAFLVESISAVETIKSMAVEPQMRKRWETQLAAYVKAAFRTMSLSNVANQVAALINKVTMILILWIGARLVMNGQLTVGQLVAFNMLAGRVSGPVLRLVQLWQDFQQATISIKRLGDVLNTPREGQSGINRATLPRSRGRIQFDNVSFRYKPESPPVLNNVSMTVAPGELIGVVGRSGSGKSTLVKLIQRLHAPESGRILVDGIDIRHVDTTWLRQQIGFVLQDSVLFSRSIRDNIALRNPGVSMDRVIRAAKLAGAHDFISELSEGYDTEVGEHGASLSGGQRQRIAIARALIDEPRILLLDEATSALDYETELLLQENMSEIGRGRTVIIIAHRLSTVRSADRIIVLERGCIAEIGKHEELVGSGGIYSQLHGHQAGLPSVSRRSGTTR